MFEKKSRQLEIVVLLLLVISGMLLGVCESYKLQPDQATLQLNGYHEAQFTGYYMAKAKGFYANENIEVTINWGARC